MTYIVDTLNRMDEQDLVLFLTNRSEEYLLSIYRSIDGYRLNCSIKNYIRVLDERRFIDMYDLDLYAYLRVFTTSKCIKYYMSEGLMNKKNMPYLPMVIEKLGIDSSILDNYADQYTYYPDGMGLFDRNINNSTSNRYLW